MINFSFLSHILEFLFVAKVGILVTLFLYSIFCVVVERQVKTMNDIVYIHDHSSLVHIVAFLQIIFSLSLFILALVIL